MSFNNSDKSIFYDLKLEVMYCKGKDKTIFRLHIDR